MSVLATRLREVKEVKVQSFIPFREADGVKLDEQKRTVRVVVISEGLGNLRDRNFYTADSVRSMAKILAKGKQCYLDHPSQSEEQDRPERSVRDLCGFYFDPKIGTVSDPDTGETLEACFATLKFDESEDGQLALSKVKAALEYAKQFPNSKDVYAGISINGGGSSHPGTIRGLPVNMVTEIQEAFSADIVTKPARGGRFLALMQEAARTAAWKRRHARESSRAQRPTRVGSGGGGAMAGTGVKPKKQTQEALIEVLKKKLKKVRESEEGARARAMQLAQGLKQIRVAAEQEGLDPKTILADIKDDFTQLDKVMKAGKGNGGAEDGEEESEGKKRAAEAEGGEDEEESEGGKKAAEAEDEDEEESEGGKKAAEAEDEDEDEEEGEKVSEQIYEEPSGKRPRMMGEGEEEDEEEGGEDEGEGYGMAGEEEDDEEKGGLDDKDSGAMQYQCAGCGEVNRVLPPKGFKLARAGEDGLSESQAVRRLKRTQKLLETKEARFVKINRQHAQKIQAVLQENAQLKAENRRMRLLGEAKKKLKEAGVPSSIMKARELLAFHPSQWDVMIRGMQNKLTQESGDAYRGKGAGPVSRTGKVREVDDGSAKDAIATFQAGMK